MALQGLDDLLDTYAIVRRHLNPDLRFAGVVVNEVARTREDRRRVRELQRHLGDGLLWEPFVPARAAIPEAIAAGTPLHGLRGRVERELAGCSTGWRKGCCVPSDSRPAMRDRGHPLLDNLSEVAEPRRSPTAAAGDAPDAERVVQVNVTLPASLKKRLGPAKLETGDDVKDIVQAAVAEYLTRLGF